MKTSAIIASMSLLSGAFAAPSTLWHAKRQLAPTPAQVVTAIDSWNNDVANVNAFLNLAPSQNPTDLLNAAQEALLNANDEPIELMILGGLGTELGPAGQQAVLTLQEVFGNVISSLQNIINDPGDASKVATQLQQINGVRCCSVLPSLDTLWLAAANAVGVADQVNLIVPRENACTDGTTIC